MGSIKPVVLQDTRNIVTDHHHGHQAI